MATLYCRNCGCVTDEKDNHTACPSCHNPLWVRYDLEKLRAALTPVMPAPQDTLLRQWKELLPINDESLIDAVTLGETESALLASKKIGKQLGIENLYFKLEMGPTLSLKDRGTSLCLLKALEQKQTRVCLASSGNNAGSVAAYAARAGIPAVVFIQKNVSPAKVLKCIAYGAQVVRVDGGMDIASKLCREMARRFNWADCGGDSPYRVSAKRLAGYEIIRQLKGTVPDAVLTPCGGGAGLVCFYEAFTELKEMGLIPFVPKLYGIQLEACNPIEQAYLKGMTTVTPVQTNPTLSDALTNNAPFWGEYDLIAARKTGGAILSATDDEFLRAIRMLGKEEGLFTEPAGSLAVAVLPKLLEHDPKFRQLKNVVCVLTGHGLNSPRVAIDDSELPDVISPNVNAISDYLGL